MQTHPAGLIGERSILLQRGKRVAANGCRDPYQASQNCSQRRPVRGFEPGSAFGTQVETIEILFNIGSLPMLKGL